MQIPEFARYLDVTSKVHGALKIVDPELYGVTEVIQLISRCETLTALIRISALSENQRKIISELSLGKCVASDDLKNIYKKTFSLQIIINSIPPNIDAINGNIALQPEVAQLLYAILKKIRHTIKRPSRKLVKATTTSNLDFLSYFPGLRNNYL